MLALLTGAIALNDNARISEPSKVVVMPTNPTQSIPSTMWVDNSGTLQQASGHYAVSLTQTNDIFRNQYKGERIVENYVEDGNDVEVVKTYRMEDHFVNGLWTSTIVEISNKATDAVVCYDSNTNNVVTNATDYSNKYQRLYIDCDYKTTHEVTKKQIA